MCCDDCFILLVILVNEFDCNLFLCVYIVLICVLVLVYLGCDVVDDVDVMVGFWYWKDGFCV